MLLIYCRSMGHKASTAFLKQNSSDADSVVRPAARPHAGQPGCFDPQMQMFPDKTGNIHIRQIMGSSEIGHDFFLPGSA